MVPATIPGSQQKQPKPIHLPKGLSLGSVSSSSHSLRLLPDHTRQDTALRRSHRSKQPTISRQNREDVSALSSSQLPVFCSWPGSSRPEKKTRIGMVKQWAFLKNSKTQPRRGKKSQNDKHIRFYFVARATLPSGADFITYGYNKRGEKTYAQPWTYTLTPLPVRHFLSPDPSFPFLLFLSACHSPL